MTIRLGLGLPQTRQYDIGRDIPAVAQAAEEIGYASLWVFERLLFPEPATQGLYGVPGLPWPDKYRGVAEPTVSLTLAAAATSRARLGTSVLVAPLHGPFRLARVLATLDAASGGRVVAGFGTGWSLDEYAASAVAPFEKRGMVLDELLDVCQAVWGPDPVAYDGELTTIAPSVVGPKPARPIPVLLPANSPRAARRVVDRADGWAPAALGGPQKLAEDWRRLQELAAERGRQRPLQVVVRANARYTAKSMDDGDRQTFQGSIDQIVEDLAAHVVPGLEEFLVDLQSTMRDAEELKDVAAALHEGVRAAGI